MTPERYRRVVEIFEAASVRSPDARPAFLVETCADDHELCRAVEAMLAGDAQSGGFLDKPADDLAAAAVASRERRSLIGRRISHYEVVSLLGTGGMGVVYRAKDTRLGREVAIKFANTSFSDRFEREARTVAALNHSNICTLHDVGPSYLVMELVEGLTLADRLKRGAMPLEEALSIARQIADALEAAHEKGVVHRDLKPSNIKIKPDGTVKVLDFGLAKVGEASGANADASQMISMPATQAGMILGTVAYMSPEQASGQSVDRRADIWSFGVVLWELLTGRRLFEGETVTQTLADVLRGPIDFDHLPHETPATIRGLLRRCLDRNAKNRLRDVGEARIVIEAALANETPLLEGAPEAGGARRLWLAWSIAAALAVGLASVAFLHFRQKPSIPMALVRFQIPVPEDATMLLNLSPDGRRLAFIAGDRLWVHSLESGESRDLTASTGGLPFWSPDGRFIGYPTEGKLNKIEATGGPPQTVADLRGNLGACGAWNQDDVIVFGDRQGGLFRVPASGGVPVQITALDPARHEGSHFCPSFLPDGRHFVYIRSSPDEGKSAIYLGSVDAKPDQQSSTPMVASNWQATYAPSADPSTGYLLFVRKGTLMAQPFDNRRLELKGKAAPIAEQISDNGGGTRGWAAFSASANGVLAFQRRAVSNGTLTWYDQGGKVLGTAGEPGDYEDLALSPDGTRLAVAKVSGADVSNIWLLDLSRRGAGTRFTFGSARDANPVWSPDGRRIIFNSNRDGPDDLYEKPANGGTDEVVVLKSSETKHATSWSRDGHFLLYTVVNPKTHQDIWVLPLHSDKKPIPLLVTEFNERQAHFSPDGHWVAYTSDESGQSEVYVRSFSLNSAQMAVEAGGKWQISNGFGDGPRWRGDGRELYYRSRSGGLMAVEITRNPAFRASNPHPLGGLTFAFANSLGILEWTSAEDGRRFLRVANKGGRQPYMIVLNWQAGLNK